MLLRFYAIREGLNEDLAMRVKLYREACEKRGIEYTIDYLFTEGKEIILKEYIMSDYIIR